MRLLPCVDRRGFVAARLFGDGFLHRVRGQHRVGEQAARGQVRADDRGADALEVRAQHARELAHGAFGVEPFADDAAQVDRRREAQGRVAAVEQDREQAAEAADQRPVFREQHAEPAAGLVRRAADEDRHRHQLHVQPRVRAVRLDQPRQRFGTGLAVRRRLVLLQGELLRELLGRGLERATGAAARERDVGALAPERIARQRAQRRGQAGLATGALEDQRIRQAVVLEHVADRARVDQFGRVGGLDFDLHPRRHQPAEQSRPPRAARVRFGSRWRRRCGRGCRRLLHGFAEGHPRIRIEALVGLFGRSEQRRLGRGNLGHRRHYARRARLAALTAPGSRARRRLRRGAGNRRHTSARRGVRRR